MSVHARPASQARKIEAVCRRRGIRDVLHFTRGCNLPRILKRGLLTREQLEQLAREDPDFRVAFNDELRLDEQRNSVSLSLSFPNSSLFYRWRKSKYQGIWSVLKLDASVLWNYPCSFCPDNAAGSDLHRKHDELAMAASLDAMFGKATGKRNGLSQWIPTKVQAEVLAYASIPPDLIQAVCFETEQDRAKALEWCDGLIGDQKFEVDSIWFSSRDFVLERLQARRPEETWPRAPFSFLRPLARWFGKFRSNLFGTPASRGRRR
ncbi:DUF4433 domain-containing protein [bacterium CPR1]|nr:DUF4433 domain-containing protein [bacterium CPR1]